MTVLHWILMAVLPSLSEMEPCVWWLLYVSSWMKEMSAAVFLTTATWCDITRPNVKWHDLPSCCEMKGLSRRIDNTGSAWFLWRWSTGQWHWSTYYPHIPWCIFHYEVWSLKLFLHSRLCQILETSVGHQSKTLLSPTGVHPQLRKKEKI